MVKPGILRQLSFFEDLPDAMIEKMASICEIKVYREGEFLNKRSREAKYFYIILKGEISLEMENLAGKTVRLETIAPGGAIGFSSLIETESKHYLSDAKALTNVEILRFVSDDLELLFYKDFKLGFLIMKKIALVAKRRLTYRTHPLAKP